MLDVRYTARRISSGTAVRTGTETESILRRRAETLHSEGESAQERERTESGWAARCLRVLVQEQVRWQLSLKGKRLDDAVRIGVK